MPSDQLVGAVMSHETLSSMSGRLLSGLRAAHDIADSILAGAEAHEDKALNSGSTTTNLSDCLSNLESLLTKLQTIKESVGQV